jgi:LysR family transcriptional regulator, hydrogen peroxide-inducible genes activator
MTITQLGYVLALEKHLSFVLAAEYCNISQPALSMQVKKLEDTLGVELFDRSSTPIRITAIGAEIIQQAKFIFKEVNQVSEIISEYKDLVSGTVKLGIIPTVSPYLLPLFIRKLETAHPNLSLEIEELTTKNIEEKLRNGTLDMGILATPLNQPDFQEYPLYYEELVAYISPENLLYQKNYILSKELDLNQLWLLEEGHCLRNQIENFCELKQKNSTNSQLKLRTGSLETVIKLADNYAGMTLLPELAIQDWDAEKLKKIRRFSKEKPMREISLITEKTYKRHALLAAIKGEIMASLPMKLRDNLGDKLLSIR